MCLDQLCWEVSILQVLINWLSKGGSHLQSYVLLKYYTSWAKYCLFKFFPWVFKNLHSGNSVFPCLKIIAVLGVLHHLVVTTFPIP